LGLMMRRVVVVVVDGPAVGDSGLEMISGKE
jgi:hypothetical protein